MSNSINPNDLTSPISSAPASSFTPREIRAESERMAPEIDAIALVDTVPVNIEPTAAATTAIGVAPEFEALLPELSKVFPESALAKARKLRSAALALMGAHLDYEISREPEEPVREHMDRLQELRARFSEEVRPMLLHGTIDAMELEGVRNTTGYQAMLHDVGLYCAVFRRHWAEIESRSYLTVEVLNEADRLVGEAFDVLGRREQSPARVSEVFLRRQRAFTLFIECYGEVRRLVQFIRFNQKDADDIAPSLYAGRRGSRRRRGEEENLDGPAALGEPEVEASAAEAGVAARRGGESPFVGAPPVQAGGATAAQGGTAGNAAAVVSPLPVASARGGAGPTNGGGAPVGTGAAAENPFLD